MLHGPHKFEVCQKSEGIQEVLEGGVKPTSTTKFLLQPCLISTGCKVMASRRRLH